MMASVRMDISSDQIARALVDAGPTRVAEVLNQIAFLWTYDGKIKHAAEATSNHLNKHGVELLREMRSECADLIAASREKAS